MVNQDMLTYVRAQLAAGLSRDMIKKALATGGWSDADATEAFGAIDGVQVAPLAPSTPPLAPAPMQPAQPVMQPRPIMQPAMQQSGIQQIQRSTPLSTMAQSTPMTPRPAVVPAAIMAQGVQPMQPMQPAASLGKPLQPRKKSSGLWQWLVIILLILLTLGGAYVYLFGIPPMAL